MTAISDKAVGRIVRLDTWEQVRVAEAAKIHRLVLATHNLPHPNRLALLFVHGLGGDPITTWQRFPELAFHAQELANFDIGLFGYRSGVFTNLAPGLPKLDIREKSLDLAADIRVLFDEDHYDGVVIVAHSMGGIVAKFAIRQLLELDPMNGRRILGLYLCGTPQYGSLKAIWPLRWFSPDLRLLAAFSADLSDLQLFWNSRITTDPIRMSSQRFFLDERALVGTHDRLVKRGSGVGSLPFERVQTVNLPHTKLVKPRDAQAPTFQWLLMSIEEGRSARQPRILDRIGAAPPPREKLQDGAPDLERQVILYLKAYFESEYLVEGGRSANHRAGDVFVVVQNGALVTDSRGRPMYMTRSHKNYLTATHIEEHITVCELHSVMYKELPSPLDAVPQIGDEVELISREEWRRFSELEKQENAARDFSGARRNEELIRLLILIDTMIAALPDSYLVKGALHMKARTQLALQRYAETIHTLDNYRDRYPDRPDRLATGAISSLVEEAKLRQAVAVNDSIKHRVSLALHLVREPEKEEEAVDILRTALDVEPELVRKELPEAGERSRIAALLAVHTAQVPLERFTSRIEEGDSVDATRRKLLAFIAATDIDNAERAVLLRRVQSLIGNIQPTPGGPLIGGA